MKVLIISPHPDDEILGVGGTIAKRIKQGHEVYIGIVTKGIEPLFSKESVEAVRDECRNAHAYLGVKDTFFLDFPAVMMEDVPRYKLNEAILELVQKIQPDEVYLPHRGDMQMDHKLTVDAAMVALRPKYSHAVGRILAYETLSETGWDIPNAQNEFIPTVYEDISDQIDQKLQAMACYQSQLAAFPNARSVEAVKALAQYRGATISCMAAEAFMLIREVRK